MNMTQADFKKQIMDRQFYYDTTSNIYLNAVTQPEISSRNFHKKKKKNSKSQKPKNNYSMSKGGNDNPMDSLKRIQ